MNKVILYGNVGKDPEVKTFEGGSKVAKFSLATSSYSKDKNGDKVTQTEWHNIVVWNKLADICEKHVKKGSSLIIEGEIRYRQYEDREGNKKYITEISCNNLHFTGKKEETKPAEKLESAESDPSFVPENFVDSDLPF